MKILRYSKLVLLLKENILSDMYQISILSLFVLVVMDDDDDESCLLDLIG